MPTNNVTPISDGGRRRKPPILLNCAACNRIMLPDDALTLEDPELGELHFDSHRCTHLIERVRIVRHRLNDTGIDVTDRRHKLRAVVRGDYDLSMLRIQMGGRLVANFRARLGFPQGAAAAADDLSRGDDDEERDIDVEIAEAVDSEESGDEEKKREMSVAKKVIAQLKQQYALFTEGVARNREIIAQGKFQGNEIINTYTDLVLIHNFFQIWEREKKGFALLQYPLQEWPIYHSFLRHVPGCGPAMTGVLLSELDIFRAMYPTSFHVYAGLDVDIETGTGRSRRKEHLVQRPYIDRNGNLEWRDSVTFNPWLKTKLMGVLGPLFIKTASPYATVYRDYKHRLQHRHWEGEPWTKGHIHVASVRYMVKMFLNDLHHEWCKAEGLPPVLTYPEAKLGLVHSQPYIRETLDRSGAKRPRPGSSMAAE